MKNSPLFSPKLLLGIAAAFELAFAADFFFHGAIYSISPLALYALLSVAPFAGLTAMRRVEDDDPMFAVIVQRIIFMLMIVLAVAGHAATGRFDFSGAPTTTMAQMSFVPDMLRLGGMLSSATTGMGNIPIVTPALVYTGMLFAAIIGYGIGAWAVLGLLRTIERRPSLATLFIWNGAALVALDKGDPSLLVGGLLVLAVLLMLREKRWLSYALFAISSGIGLLGTLAFVLFNKHHLGHVKPEQKRNAMLMAVVLFLAIAIPVSEIWGIPMGDAMLKVGVLLAAGLVFYLVTTRYPDVAGRDLLPFALLLGGTIIVCIMKHDLGGIIYLLPLAAIFRSGPQLFLAFALGGLALEPTLSQSLPLTIGVWVVFVGLFLSQLRYSWKETGLFKSMEVKV